MRHTITKRQIIVLIVITWLIASILVLLFFPSVRKGPFGFGPPASMTTFQMKDGSFSISYPGNWIAYEMPQGYHGDDEIITSISVSGREFAIINIARKSFVDGNLNDVMDWGQSRAAQHIDYLPDSIQPLNVSETKGFIQEYKWLHSAYDKILMHCQDVYVFADNVGYSISFCSQEQDWLSLKDFFIEMRESFSILEANK